MKILSFFFLNFFALFMFAQNTEAKVLPQAGKAPKQLNNSKTTTSGISVSPKLRSDRRALNVYFSNLQNAKSINYSLVYKTSNQEEGAIGSVSVINPRATQEILFGTCSRNVCRYHSGIKDVKLEVNYTLKSGKKYLKRYRIKV